MTWFLVVLFLTASGGGVEMREGWYPIEQPNERACAKSVDWVIDWLNVNMPDTHAVAYCLGTPIIEENI